MRGAQGGVSDCGTLGRQNEIHRLGRLFLICRCLRVRCAGSGCCAMNCPVVGAFAVKGLFSGANPATRCKIIFTNGCYMLVQNLSLPNRPIKIAANTISRPSGTLLAAVVIGALVAFMAIWQIPSLLRDMQIRNAPVIVQDGDVQDGRCTARKGIFVDCEAHVSYNYKGQHYESDVNLFFVDFHTGDYDVDLVISGEKPQLATISIALDKFWNRVVLLAVFLLGFAAMVGAAILASIRVARARGQLAVPGRLSLVMVAVQATGRAWGRDQFSYQQPDAKTAHSTLFDKGTAPLLLRDEVGGQYGYAVKHEAVSIPVLLDRDLNRLELTTAERSQMLAEIETVEATQPPPPKPAAKRSPWRVLLTFLRNIVLLVVFVVLAVVGYWLYYALAATNAFNSPGMDINNMMPASMNAWACGKLQQRFGDERAPFGCVAEDFTSWK